MRYEGRGVLVFGGTGFIGRWVVAGLRREGARVHLAARDVARAAALRDELDLGGEVVAFDAGAAGGLAELVGALRPCVTFNLVGYGVGVGERDEAEHYRVNGRFVRSLCGALLLQGDTDWPGARLVHAGSQLEYGPIGGVLDEEAVESADTVYGLSKLEGTRAVRAAAADGLRGVTARLFNVYGAGEQPGRLLPSLIEAAAARRPVELTAGLQELDFVYVGDVAEGLLRLGAAAVPAGAVVNLATGVLTRVRDFALATADALGMPRELLLFGRLPARPAEMRYRRVSNARLRELTGWTPVTTVAEGIGRTLRGMSYATR